MSEEYSVDLQKLFIEFMQSDHDLFVRCNSITKPIYFDRPLQSTMRFIQEHADNYNSMPSLQQVKAKTGINLEEISGGVDSHKDWFLDEYERFCRYKALEHAIIASTEKLEKKEYGAVEKLIKDAVSIGLAKQIGMNYWENPYERLKDIQNNKPVISTGWKSIDSILYGGFERGTLNIFAAPSGHGKSLFLQNIALNWALAGFNVVYVSLELSEKLCSMRLDSMLTQFSTRELFKNIDDVSLKLGMISKKAGNLQIVQLPNGITVNDLKAYMKEYQIQTGIKVDAVLVDYLDLMSPASQKVSLDNVFMKDKLVSEELRNFAIETDYLFATASQINRGGLDEAEYGMGNVAGGLSKVYTADNVIGIHASRAMKERGRIQIEFIKTRSSGGEGKKVDLLYDQTCMRIADLADDDQYVDNSGSSGIMDRLKSKMANNSNNENISNNGNDIPPPPTNSKSLSQQALSKIPQRIDTDKLRNILKRQD